MSSTKKVKQAGRFGPRYGKGIRDRVTKIEVKQRKLHRCPNCGFKTVKRISTGIYKCKKCNTEFAGGAYTPATMTGKIVTKMVKQRKFTPLVKELLEVSERAEEEIAENANEEEQKKTIKE